MTVDWFKYDIMYNRARWDWPQRPKFQNWDLHTWISIGNWILNLICFLQFFDLSTPFAVLLRFYFLPFLHGKNAQNRPENQQNWNLAKIRLKTKKWYIYEIKAVTAIFGECLNYKSVLRILIMPPEVPFFGLKDGHFWQKWLFSDNKKWHF